MTPDSFQAFYDTEDCKSIRIKGLRAAFDAGQQRFAPRSVGWSSTPPSGTLTGLTAAAEGVEGYEQATGIPAVMGLTHEVLFCSAQLFTHERTGTRIETPEWLHPHLTGWLEAIEPGWALGSALPVFQRRCADALLRGLSSAGELDEMTRSIVMRWRELLCGLIDGRTQHAAPWAALRKSCAQATGLPPFDHAVLTLIDTVAWPDDDANHEWLRGWDHFLVAAPRAQLEADLDPVLAALHVASQAAWGELHARAAREPGFDLYRHADAQPAIVAAGEPTVRRRLYEAAVQRGRPLVEALFKVFVESLQEARALVPTPKRAASASASAGGRGLIDLQVGQFDVEVLQAAGLVLVDFWAEWCAPCKQFMPTLGALERQFGDRVKFIKVDVDQHDEVAKRLGIRALPTLMLYRDGQPLERVNSLTRARIEALLQAKLA